MHETRSPAARPEIPDVPVIGHDGRPSMFYEDLVRGKVVVVHFLSPRREAEYPVCPNLYGLRLLLDSRGPRVVTLVSIVDPKESTQASLRDLGRRYGREGWRFLSGTAEAFATLRSAFFAGQPEPGHEPWLALLRIGNDRAGLWGSAPASATPESLAERLSWIESRTPQPPGTPLRRGGPMSAGSETRP